MKPTRILLAIAMAAGTSMASNAVDPISEVVPGRPDSSEVARAHQDVRIGAPRTVAQSVDLDSHRSTGNLFAAVAWSDGWSMNISTDGGASWQETYFYPSASDISMKVGGDFVWVAYASSAVPSALRMRRFSADTGASDTVYNYQTIENIHPATVVDVAMTSNADDVDSGIYIACIGSDNAAYFFWDNLDGTSFDPYHPAVTDAEGDLDITINPDFGSGYFMFMSFQGSGFARVWRLPLFGAWEHTSTTLTNGDNPFTAISAFEDTVVTVVEADFTHGNGIRQFVNTNAGAAGDWAGETVFYPYDATIPDAAGPDVSVRSPYGSIVTFQLEEGAFDGVYYRYRSGHGPGGFGAHVLINEIDAASQEQTTVEWLGARCVSSYGIVYLSGGDFIPYFDLMSPRGFFCDGFETADTSGWD